MDAFSHLSVLISIILGLAITQVLQGLRGIVIARARVRRDWVPVLWAAVVLLVCVQSWWAMFGLRGVREWSFLTFAVVLIQVLATYLQAAFVLPDFGSGAFVDLREHYFEHLEWFFGALVLTLVASLLKDVALDGRLPAGVNVAFHLALGAAALIAIRTRHRRYHELFVLLTAAALAVYTLSLFMQLE